MSTNVAISAADVNKLRNLTGAGMMDCKKALTEAGGDFEAAIDNLRKKGAKLAAARQDRDAKEGVVIAQSTTDGTRGIVLELNCETDFVAKNSDFIAFAQSVADLALAQSTTSLEELLALNMDGVTVATRIEEQTGKIGEKLGISKFETLTGAKIVPYIHAGYRLGVLVALTSNADGKADEAGKDVAMQIAAMNPVAVDKDGIDATTITRELEIAKEQTRAEGKPEEMVEKIAQGRLTKFYKDSTLLNQEFVKDSSKSVAQFLESMHKGLTVTAFKRVALGA